MHLSTEAKSGREVENELNTFRYAFINVRCLTIEEAIIMMADALQFINARLRSIKCDYCELFGRSDVILCADLRQLPPVRAREVYKLAKTESVSNTVGFLAPPFLLFTILTRISDGAELTPVQVRLIKS